MTLLDMPGPPAPKRAFILYRNALEPREERLGRILSFFGVPWQPMSLDDVVNSDRLPDAHHGVVLFGSAETIGTALAVPRAASVLCRAAALYVFASENRESSTQTLSALAGTKWKSGLTTHGPASVQVTDRFPQLTGPLGGIQFTMPPAAENETVAPSGAAEDGAIPIISVNGAPAFLYLRYQGIPAFFSASAAIVDIDEPVHRNYYDVKDHFLAAAPVVLFVMWAFREVMWRPRELGACLVIDDPLLKPRYGFCDFEHLRDLMRRHRFTTNIAFIPWNWRRTTRRAGEFFRRESDVFSVSVHGCDHVAAEFGSPSRIVIDGRARLAQTRMRGHQVRTDIEHDPVMVFPQGVFSASCPEVLKRNGFVAAVNTEISPVDGAGPQTRVRDAWDIAILRYGSFPIFTRRYQHHGLENFAFDLLLGKPCFIVAHHAFFRDRGAALVSLIEKLQALNCTLNWRSPREIVRRAYRERKDNGRAHVQMFGTELLLGNRDSEPRQFFVQKREIEANVVGNIVIDGHEIEWTHAENGLNFPCLVPPRSEALVEIRYRDTVADHRVPSSVRYQLAVAARRILSEVRDEYVQKLYVPRTPSSDAEAEGGRA